jgi:hypothetical protein
VSRGIRPPFRVVPDAELQAKALRFAQRLAAGPTKAHGVTKQVLRAYLGEGTRAADALTGRIAPTLFESEDMQNGIVSLLENGPGHTRFTGGRRPTRWGRWSRQPRRLLTSTASGIRESGIDSMAQPA